MTAQILLLFCIVLTVGAYALSRTLAKRRPSPLTTPVFFSMTLIIGVLYAAGLDYQDYRPAKDIMVLLLGPATVALAVPIYKNRATLRAHVVPALAGIVFGSIATISAVLISGAAFQFSKEVTLSMSV